LIADHLLVAEKEMSLKKTAYKDMSAKQSMFWSSVEQQKKN